MKKAIILISALAALTACKKEEQKTPCDCIYKYQVEQTQIDQNGNASLVWVLDEQTEVFQDFCENQNPNGVMMPDGRRRILKCW